MAGRREERIALNEAVFRTANERMADWEERHGARAAELYFCECADPECREKVALRERDYERVRADSTHFVVLPGHELPDVESIVEEGDGWLVIEKDPNVHDIAAQTDPRR